MQSFVGKFMSLWSTGEEVTLKISAINGKAKVFMKVDIGEYTAGHSIAYKYGHHDKVPNFGSSRQRRRERRTNEREKAAEQADENTIGVKTELTEEHGETTEEEVACDQVEDILVSANEPGLMDNKVETEEVDSINLCVTDNSNSKPKVEAENSSDGNVSNALVGPVDNSDNNDRETDDYGQQGSTVCTNVVTNRATGTEVEVKKEEITAKKPIDTEMIVYSKVNFDCCPNNKLTGNDMKIFEGILFRHDHLRRNIKKIEYGHYTTREHSNDDGLFKHAIDMKIVVDTTRLWETARSYMWKHIGQDEWKLVNGTMVTVNRIHSKH